MNNWRELFFDKSLCSGSVINNGSGNITVKGHLKQGNMNAKIMYFAANPAKVVSQSFSRYYLSQIQILHSIIQKMLVQLLHKMETLQ